MKAIHTAPELERNNTNSTQASPGTETVRATETTPVESWLPLSQFLQSLFGPSSWRFVCENAIRRNYQPNAPALFRFFDMTHDPHCIVSCMDAEPCDLCCIYASKDGVMEITYLGHDLSIRICVNEIIRVKEKQAVALLMKQGIVVLMKINASFRLSSNSTCSNSMASAVSSLSDRRQEPQELGVFSVLCDPVRRERVCSACRVVWFRSMPKCGRCQDVRYCSRLCQRRHWIDHRQSCRQAVLKIYNGYTGEAEESCAYVNSRTSPSYSNQDAEDPFLKSQRSPRHQVGSGHATNRTGAKECNQEIRDPPPTAGRTSPKHHNRDDRNNNGESQASTQYRNHKVSDRQTNRALRKHQSQERADLMISRISPKHRTQRIIARMSDQNDDGSIFNGEIDLR